LSHPSDNVSRPEVAATHQVWVSWGTVLRFPPYCNISRSEGYLFLSKVNLDSPFLFFPCDETVDKVRFPVSLGFATRLRSAEPEVLPSHDTSLSPLGFFIHGLGKTSRCSTELLSFLMGSFPRMMVAPVCNGVFPLIPGPSRLGSLPPPYPVPLVLVPPTTFCFLVLARFHEPSRFPFLSFIFFPSLADGQKSLS